MTGGTLACLCHSSLRLLGRHGSAVFVVAATALEVQVLPLPLKQEAPLQTQKDHPVGLLAQTIAYIERMLDL